MNRGSFMQPSPRFTQQCFNEAPIHESGKGGGLAIRCASTAPLQ